MKQDHEKIKSCMEQIITCRLTWDETISFGMYIIAVATISATQPDTVVEAIDVIRGFYPQLENFVNNNFAIIRYGDDYDNDC